MKDYFNRGNGEIIGFAVVGPIICALLIFLVSFIQLVTATNAINQSLSVYARAAAVCATEVDAEKQLRSIKDYAVNSKYIKPGSLIIKVQAVEHGDCKDTWSNGNYIKVTVSAQTKTLEPFFTSKTYSKSYIIAIEGSAANEEKAIEIMKNIIYAVESGGMVYGNRNYSQWEPPYHNSGNEHYVTIGAGCWYGEEGKQILSRIPEARYIANAWSSAQYGAYRSEIEEILGKNPQAQDEFMVFQIKKYFKEAEEHGVTDISGKMEFMNMRHQGGLSAAERVLKKTSPPYTAQAFYNAMMTDTVKGQVGTFKERQNFVFEHINSQLGSTFNNEKIKGFQIPKAASLKKK